MYNAKSIFLNRSNLRNNKTNLIAFFMCRLFFLGMHLGWLVTKLVTQAKPAKLADKL